MIYGGTSTDAIDCGEGTDTAYVSTPGEGGKMVSCETVIYGDPAADDPNFSPTAGRANAGLAVGGLGLATRATPSSPHNSVGPKGTAGPDEMAGTNGVDVLIGLEGDDQLYGFDGDDDFDGGGGQDVLDGGAGNDDMFLGIGNDDADGGPGDDILWGQMGADVMRGGAGNDTLMGGSGRDRIWAGPGNDVIDSRDREVDIVDCGGGRDRVHADRSDRLIGCERRI